MLFAPDGVMGKILCLTSHATDMLKACVTGLGEVGLPATSYILEQQM
jgi:hypothetical protein